MSGFRASEQIIRFLQLRPLPKFKTMGPHTTRRHHCTLRTCVRTGQLVSCRGPANAVVLAVGGKTACRGPYTTHYPLPTTHHHPPFTTNHHHHHQRRVEALPPEPNTKHKHRKNKNALTPELVLGVELLRNVFDKPLARGLVALATLVAATAKSEVP